MGDGPIEIDHRRRHDRTQRVIERRHPRPVRLAESARACVAGGDRGLQRVRSVDAAESLGALQGGEAAADQELVPAGAVLLGKKNRRAIRRSARGQTRRLDLHQRKQAEDLGLV